MVSFINSLINQFAKTPASVFPCKSQPFVLLYFFKYHLKKWINCFAPLLKKWRIKGLKTNSV